MPYGTFTLYNALGGVTWATVVGGLGYAFGRNLPILEHYLGRVTIALVLLAALGEASFRSIRWFRDRSDRTRATVIVPGWQLASSPPCAGVRARYGLSWSFVAARFRVGEYLGLYLALGFVVSLAALWVFSGVTADVITRAPLTAVDLQAGAWLRAHASPMGDRVAMVVTLLGSPVAVAVLTTLVAAVLAHRRSWIALTAWIAAFVGGGALNWVLKQLIQRPRPPGAAAFLYDSSSSYPSAHAMGSLLTYGMLAYLLITRWPWARRHHVRVMFFALTLVVVIGLSPLPRRAFPERCYRRLCRWHPRADGLRDGQRDRRPTWTPAVGDGIRAKARLAPLEGRVTAS